MVNQKKVRVTLVRSMLGYPEHQRKTVRALGLKKMHQTVEVSDTVAVRGMVAKVSHLLKMEEVKE